MALRQAAWCYALARGLRKQDSLQDLSGLAADSDFESLESGLNIPNELLRLQASELKDLYEHGRLELFQFIELERTLTRLTDSMGGCERIRNTPFPQFYSRLVQGMIYLFVAFLPLGLFSVPAVGLILSAR